MVPPWMLAVAAMFSVQLGSALSAHVMDEIGPGGTAWLRLGLGAIILLIFVRPPIRQAKAKDWPLLIGLGVTTAVQTIFFLGAIDRIPLGTSVSIEFLGPLTVAALGSRRKRMLVWPALALVGVVLMSRPWEASFDLVGILFAAVAAVGWGVYILLTQKLGDRFSGVGVLSISVPVAAVVTTVVGLPQAMGHMSWSIVLVGVGLALLMPVLPYIFEFLALKRMNQNAFGTLMALEPAFGVLLGLLVLHQSVDLLTGLGLVLVITGGVASQFDGSRESVPEARETVDLAPVPTPLAGGDPSTDIDVDTASGALDPSSEGNAS